MNATHTPGPWHSALLPNKVIARPLLGDDAVAIASVSGRTAAETAANARLIAAAPEMRDLLNSFIVDCERRKQHGLMLTTREGKYMDEARDLLARIDGKAQG